MSNCKPSVWMIATILGLAGSPAAWADRHFTNSDLRGSYSWTLEGTFAGTSLVAVNQFTADGEGVFSGERTINLGTGGLNTTFVCQYSVKPNGFGTATCDVEILGRENFVFVLTDGGRQVHFISVTSGAVIRGEAQKQ
jgi:hypothetical protein